jgi:hypothetical protein
MADKDTDFEREAKLNEVYLDIILRYKELIEEKEHLSVSELPTLVTPKSNLVAKEIERIKSSFGIYNYNSDFFEASVQCFSFVKNEIGDLTLPIQFWLTPDDTIRFRLGDLLDRNILLCSMLLALGNPSSKVFVAIKGSIRVIFTYYEFEDHTYVLDILKDEIKLVTKVRDFIHGIGLDEKDGDTTVYEFNDKVYLDVV